jgi:MarR family transcriptional regulator, 2-MHQ and catechol-resistance regulon repressor
MAQSFRDSATLALLRALHRSYRDVQCVDSQHLEEKWGLQHSEFDVIATLGNTDGIRMGEIAARTLSSPANVTRLVKRLEGRGLVERQRSPQSDREVIARLTPAGAELFEDSYPAQVRFLKAWFDDRLSQDEQEALIRALQTLRATQICDEERETE